VEQDVIDDFSLCLLLSCFSFFFLLDLFIRGEAIHIYTEFPGQFILEFLEILIKHVMDLPCNISSSTAKFPNNHFGSIYPFRSNISFQVSREPHD